MGEHSSRTTSPLGLLCAVCLVLAVAPLSLLAQAPEPESPDPVVESTTSEELSQSTEVRSGLTRETLTLDERIDAYAERREIEREALEQLVELNALLDQTIVDPNTQPQELIDLETEITAARDQACGTSLESGGARQAMYDQMLRLQALIDAWERRSIDLLEAGADLAGTWRIEGEDRANGLMSLEQSGNRLSGTFRLSNGSRGSAIGTFSGEVITLRLVEATSRALIDVEAELETPREFPFEADNTPLMTGRWQTLELADGRPSGGEWKATWLSLEQALEIEP